MCDRNCFECCYEDCINERASFAELKDIYEQEKREARESELLQPDIDRRRRWELMNPKRAAENKRRHYEKNKEKVSEQHHAYYERNREKVLEQQKKYYQGHKDIANARNREAKRRRWAADPEYYRQKQRDYRARKKQEALVCIS